jgi:hypothetical protein
MVAAPISLFHKYSTVAVGLSIEEFELFYGGE